MTKMLSVINRGSASHAGLSKLNMAGMGPSMMRTVAKKNGVAALEELIELARDLDVKLWPCQMTLDLMGLRMEDPIGGLADTVGAATVLERMRRSARALFVKPAASQNRSNAVGRARAVLCNGAGIETIDCLHDAQSLVDRSPPTSFDGPRLLTHEVNP